MKSNASEVAMSTTEFELLAPTPVHTDRFSATPPDKVILEIACQWRCSLPGLELDDLRTIHRAHVDTLLCAVFL